MRLELLAQREKHRAAVDAAAPALSMVRCRRGLSRKAIQYRARQRNRLPSNQVADRNRWSRRLTWLTVAAAVVAATRTVLFLLFVCVTRIFARNSAALLPKGFRIEQAERDHNCRGLALWTAPLPFCWAYVVARLASLSIPLACAHTISVALAQMVKELFARLKTRRAVFEIAAPFARVNRGALPSSFTHQSSRCQNTRSHGSKIYHSMLKYEGYEEEMNEK